MIDHLSESLLNRFHAEDLSVEQRAEVAAHLEGCAACAARSAKLTREHSHLLHQLRWLAPNLDQPEVRDRREPRRLRPGDMIGPYRVADVLGQGGMGEVYLADQQKPVRRRVALKVIKLGMATDEVVSRFETEREALAMMNHPHVAKVFDAGTTEQGRPYFVMEYVPGIPITAYCDTHRLNIEQRLRLFMDVCHAVQHAHQKGIIHRDIKPANVLVTVEGDRPTPKVIDFGVAKATQQRIAERTFYTERGQLIGTPEYMSPEQAEMSALDVDTRSDIYSLGVLLYELLVGAHPFDDTTLRQAGYAEIQRIIREVDPPKPSTKLTNLGAHAKAVTEKRRTELTALKRELRGDLDWIVMKCIEKDRVRRYETANAVVLEIQRYLNDEPVLAGPPNTAYRMRKFITRNKAAVAGVTAVLLTLVAGATTSTVLYFRAAEAEELAAQRAAESKQQADIARRVTGFLVRVFNLSDADKAGGNTVSAQQVLDRGVDQFRDELRDQPRVRATLLRAMGSAYSGLGLLQPAEQMLRESKQLFEADADVPPEELGETLEFLASLLWRRDDYDEAERIATQHVELMRSAYGSADQRTILAESILSQYQHRKYEPTGSERAAMMATMAFALGVVDPNHYQPEDAAATREARRIFNEHGPEEALRFVTKFWHQRLETVRRFADQGRYDDAKEHIRRYHRPILNYPLLKDRIDLTLNEIAKYLESRGDTHVAQCFALEAVDYALATRGAGHRHVPTWQSTLGQLLFVRGLYAQAEATLRDALDRCLASPQENHPSLALIKLNLGKVLQASGRYAEAQQQLDEALAIAKAAHGETSAAVALTLIETAKLKADLGDGEAAETSAMQAIHLIRSKYGNEDVALCNPCIQLADILLKRGKNNEAETNYSHALSIARSRLSNGHPDLTASLIGLSRVRCLDRDFASAERFAHEALAAVDIEQRLDRSPASSLRRARAQWALADVKIGRGQFSRAEAHLIESWEALRKIGTMRQDIDEAVGRLIRLYRAWDTAEPNQGHLDRAAAWEATLHQEHENREPAAHSLENR